MLYIAYPKFNNFRTFRPNKSNITCLIKNFLKVKITFLLDVSVSFENELLSKNEHFFIAEFTYCQKKWKKVIANDGKYFE